LENKVKSTKAIALLFAASALAVAQPVQGQSKVVLVEQAINFKLKLTTLTPPVIRTGSSGTEFSAKLNTFTGTVTTKDILRTLGFSPSAKLVARLVADTSTQPAQLSQQVVVQQGANETDVTSILGNIIPFENPIAALEEGVFATGVAKGKVNASLLHGTIRASLNALTYEQASAHLSNLSAAGFSLGNLDFNASGVSRVGIALKGSLSGVSLGLSTTTQLVGGATLSQTPLFGGTGFIPAVVQGTITTKGRSHANTLNLIELLDVTQLLGS
jgi:hypothetical protein